MLRLHSTFDTRRSTLACMWHRYTAELHSVVHAALRHAGQSGRNCAAATDLVQAMTDAECHARIVLHRLSATDAIHALLKQNHTEHGAPLERASQLDADAGNALRLAIDEAIAFDQRLIGSEHLLLALLRELHTTPALNGISYRAARAEVVDGMRNGWDAAAPKKLLRPFRYVKGVSRALLAKATLAKRVMIDLSVAHPKIFSNPYPLYARWRKQGIHRDPVIGFWIVTRYSQAVSILRNPQFVRDLAPFVPAGSARSELPAPVRLELASIPEYLSQIMLLQDPPRHTRLRGLVSAAFTPAKINAMQARIQQIADELLDAAKPKGELDLIQEFAYPLPTIVICEMLGVPPEDRERLKHWSDDVAGLLTSTNTLADEKHAGASLHEIRNYFSRIIANLRQHPNNSLLSALAAAEAAGEKLSETELYANAVLLLAAGHETTTNLIGNGMLALLRNPGQLEKLRAMPELLPGAIEELMRFDSPVQWTARICGAKVELDGAKMKPGDFVLVGLGSANRDPEQFPNADRLDITRPDNRHISFGAGIHFCLGAALARMEGAVAIGTLLKRYPKLSLPRQNLKWRRSRPLRGLLNLKLLLK